MAKKDKQIQFEEAYKRLDDIVTKLESGDLSLEDSMTLFEEGIILTKTCKSRLEAAEQKIQLLLKDSGGNLSLEDID